MSRSILLAWSIVSFLSLTGHGPVRAHAEAAGSADAGTTTGDSVRRPELPKGVLDKPFLKRIGRGAAIGGYIDLELKADENGSTFDQHRFVPFIYAQVSDRVSMASEIEFEHGGFVTGEPEETDGEIKIEFAHLDFSAAEWLTFRAGVLLSPLGRFNLTHDSPANDLTDRPLVATQVIPTTLSESGMGVLGTLYPSESSVLTYEAYLVNGFNEGILGAEESEPAAPAHSFGAGAASNSYAAVPLPFARLQLREGRGSAANDNNNARSFVGRIGLSPRLGIDLGASIHHGRYTDRDEPRKNLTIAALDGIYSPGPLELVGEFATASAGLLDEVQSAKDTAHQNGFYTQANYHFLPGAVRSLPNSVFTGVVRFDQVDYNTDDPGLRDRRLTLGVNFRPTEDTAFKFDVNRTWHAPAGSSRDDQGFDALRFSLASYF